MARTRAQTIKGGPRKRKKTARRTAGKAKRAVAALDARPPRAALRQLRALATELEQRVAQRTAELEAETAFGNALLDTASALILVLDAAGHIVRFNKACEEVSGLNAEEARGNKGWEVLVPEQEREGVRRAFDALLAGSFPSRYENHWRHRDGTQRLIAWSNTCLLDARGAVQYVVATGIDITERRCAEEELLRRQAEVARLHRLHAMGELAALLAHELNQPLAAIAGYGEASLGQLQRGESAEKLQRNLEQIVGQAQRASHSIRELRQFLEKEQPEKAAVDLKTVLRAACDLVEGLARARGIALECAGEASLPRVMAPAIHVEHVLVNLLQNALDAIRDAGMAKGVVSVRVRRDDEDKVEISVTDSGPGIGPELAQKIFEPLYTTKSDGLGLGLSICRSIVEGLGGRIWAEPGPGGKFFFTLPVGP